MSESAARPAWAEDIRSKRLRLCWTQNELARRLELAADAKTREQLPSRSSIIREIRFHESGRHKPGSIYAELYRRVWATAGAQLLAAGTNESANGHHPSSADLEDPTRIVAQARFLIASNVDGSVLRTTQNAIEQVIATYEGQGPWPLMYNMRGMRTALHNLLNGRQPPAQRRALFVLAGQVSGLLSYMAVNTGRLVLAEAYATEAAMLAREAGDIELQMWVLGTRSFGLYYQGRYVEADAAAAAGIELAPSSPQAIRLLINGRARALARIADSGERAQRMIGEALALSDRAEDLPSGMSPCIAFGPYSPARTMANAVTAFLSLHKPEQVLSYAAQLDELVEGSDSRWSKALVRLDVASALLAKPSPEVERAMKLGREALEVTAETPIRSVSQRARELAHQAERWAKNSEAVAFRQYLGQWNAGPLSRTVTENA